LFFIAQVKPKKSKTKAEKSSKASSSKTEEEDFSFPVSCKEEVYKKREKILQYLEKG